MREMFKGHYHRIMRHPVISGEVEIDESLLSRKLKCQQVNPHKGFNVRAFGMVERHTNTIILYPVNDTPADTLVRLINRQWRKGVGFIVMGGVPTWI
jgi:hypothetical protein